VTLAAITFEFDPVVTAFGLNARIETVALAAVLFAGLLLGARIGALTAQPSPLVPPPTLSPGELPLIAVGAVPGAVVGGRIEYVLVHLDYYLAQPGAIADPAQGAFGLSLAVVGGAATATLTALALGLPVRPWAHALALPTLFVLAAGKLVAMFGATGQGAATDLPWATAYAGPGPWGTLHAEIASHPSQVYEALGILVVLLLLGLAFRAGAFARQDGSALVAAVGLWALARLAVAFTWRDDPVLGPLGAAQIIALVVAGGCVAGLVILRRSPTVRRFRSISGTGSG
jgi:phosphatidylglycerol:prolipoprotein diacylglycerol transferase